MSDFSELCPLFSTGVFKEITFPGPMSLTLVLTQRNLLAGTGAGAKEGYFTFGRTVIVTEAWIRRLSATNLTQCGLWLVHKTSGTAALSGTVFGTVILSITATMYEIDYGYQPFVISDAKTFTSDEVLSLQIVPAMTAEAGCVGLMIRYKEK